MDRVEGRDQIDLGAGDGFLREVVAQEAAVWELTRQEVQGTAAAAAGIEYVDALFEMLGQTGHERQDVVGESRYHRLTAVLGHHLVEEGGRRSRVATSFLKLSTIPSSTELSKRDELCGDPFPKFRHGHLTSLCFALSRPLARPMAPSGGHVLSGSVRF